MNLPKGAGRHGRLRVAVLLPLVALLSALAIAACGGSSSGSGTTSKSASASTGTTGTTTSTGGGTTTTGKGGASNFAAQRAKLQACLKQHGVTLPAGGGRFRGGAPAAGGAPGGGNPGTGTTPHTFTRPSGGFRPGGAGGRGGFAGGNSKFAKAFKACGADFGGGAGGFGGGGRFRGGAGGAAPHISQTALKKFVACVRTHGYAAMPEASTSTTANGGLFPKSIESNPKFQQAAKSCESILQSAFRRPSAGGTSTSTTTAQ